LSAAVASLSLAGTAHAALIQGVPQNINGGSFDDHSIGGDNHMGWGFSGSDPEPLAINFGATLSNTGSSTFRVCGYNRSGGWMQAFEASGANCPPSAGGTPTEWFRYVTANHSDIQLFNRWHLMDLQRFALVPVPGSAGHAIAWDNDWGTCLGDNDPDEVCEQSANAGSLNVSIAPHTTKITQYKTAGADSNSSPDAVRIGIPSDARAMFPDGQYQLVAISNPYGAYSGPNNVACAAITISGYTSDPEAPAVTTGAQPSTCYVPATLNPPVTGPNGRDPLAREQTTTPPCTILASFHCWTNAPESGNYKLAQTNATAGNVVDASGATVAVPQGGSLIVASSGGSAPATVTPAATKPAPAAKVVGARSTVTTVHARHSLTARRSRSLGRSAARKVFGRHVSRLKASCHTSSSTTSYCNVSFRKSGGRYSGRVYLRYRTISKRVRWQYRVDIKKHKHGHHTTHVRRSYRTGGTA
jgi:hypothetical protein